MSKQSSMTLAHRIPRGKRGRYVRQRIPGNFLLHSVRSRKLADTSEAPREYSARPVVAALVPDFGTTTAMTHFAVQELLNGKNVDWMEKVSDAHYRKQG